MPRKKIPRNLKASIAVTYFKPQGVCLKHLDTVTLQADELEAIKLHDVDKLSHTDAATQMGISQPTFGRILNSAYTKMSTALYYGKAIAIQASHSRMLKNHTCSTCKKL
ncbi:DUF134 domain-containing protein [Candidatus Woesebacteria bacterium]|nr:DUF134 domain-containing protein [Candidatus Woesebacteria bacterium]